MHSLNSGLDEIVEHLDPAVVKNEFQVKMFFLAGLICILFLFLNL